ncbi:MAG: choice-of-anchor J domain-containing protein [Bacteroidales bacterium]|nr:choice-of-anchor J domain-containing protein [Bacteroidales bacterium]
MRKLLTLILIFASFSIAVNAQDREKERTEREAKLRIETATQNPNQKANPYGEPMQIAKAINTAGALTARGKDNVTALVASPNADDFNTHVLPAMQAFGGVDYTVTADLGALTIAGMLEYDVVLTFNVTKWDVETGTTAIAWSNKLGEFITAGGYLVEAQFVNGYDAWGLGSGTYITGGMSPFNKSTKDQPTESFVLGEVLIPDHPIMSGVTTFTTNYFVQDVTVREDATLIAKWGNTTTDPLVAVYDNIVAFNADPIFSDGSAQGPGMGGDGYKMLHNAIVWLYNNQVNPVAPAAPTALTVTPEPVGVVGANITWTNPDETFAGDPLTELTSVSLWVNDEITPEYENTTPTIGGLEDVDFTGTTAGFYTFTVYGINTAGDGAQASQTIWLGTDVPAAPTDVVLTKVDMQTNVTWTAPAVGMHAGYFDGTGVTYDVFRNPGNVQVATAQTETTFTETLTVPGNYSYNVVASNAAGLGGNAISNVLLIGDFLVYQHFDATGIPEGWTTQGLGLTNWSVANTVLAGGAANELKFSWIPSFTGASYFVSPVINTTGMNSLGLSYKDMFNDYNANPKSIGIKTTIDGGATWVVANEEVMANGNVNIGPRDNTIIIENAHVGSPDFQFAFFYDGNTFDIDGWNLDNIELIDRAGANITFTVQEGTNLLEGAIVNISGNDYTTAADGTVTAYVLVGTDVPYTVTKLGYGDVTGTITVVDGVDQDVAVEMVTLPVYEVTFTIMDEDSMPLDASITLELAGTAVANGVAAGGTFVFTGIPDGDYTFTVDMPLYLSTTGSLTVAGADVVVPNVVLTYDPDLVIGTGTIANKPYPINAFYGYSYAQSIYLKSEIADMPMTITHVKYYFNGTSLSNSNDWTIYMGHTSKSEFAGTTDWVALDELTQVYSAEFVSPTGPGWIEFDIVDFDYNGIDNLVIAVDENKAAYNGSADRFLCSEVTGNRSISYSSDSTNPDPASPETAKVTEAFIPNIILTAYPKPGADVTFIVMDGTDPVENAVVTVNAKTFTTLANGTVVAYVGEGIDIPYTVNKFGYEEYSGTVTVVDGVTQDVNVAMVALSAYSVTFNIKNTLGDNLNATVTAYYDGIEIDSQTAVDGVIVFADVPVGTYTYDVVFEGYTSIIGSTLEVDGDEIVDIELFEIYTDPYGLMVDVDGYNATFSWNNSFGFTDDFESYDDFALAFAPWTLVDVDGEATYGFSGIAFPNSGSAMAGIIFNPTATNPVMTSSLAHSGNKYVAVFNPASAAPCNDWIIAPKTMISPNGEVSFWARGGNPDYSVEKFQVAVSTTDATPASFVTISPIVSCPANSDAWVQYTYSLSAYAGQEVYVGIHVTSVDQFYFCLDDFAIGAAKGRAFESYTVYLDGAEVATDVTALNYTFEGLAVGTYTAGVKAVYTTGATEIITTDFEILPVGVPTDATPSIAVYPNPSNGVYNIIVENATVVVTDITGRIILIKEIRNNGEIDLSAQPNGIYIFKVGSRNLKVVKQ